MRCVFAYILLASAALAQTAIDLRTPAEVQRAESTLRATPQNNELAGALLDYYLNRWPDEKLHSARIQYLLWIAENRPDFNPAATIHDPRGLIVSPEDKEAYARIREAWLRQAAKQPNNAHVLLNAARFVRLTDRETAANWLKTAANLDTDNLEYANALALVYAYAITGVAAMNPFEQPTRVDLEETKSLFARQVKEEAMQDSVLGAHVAWSVHLVAMALRAGGITQIDYDTVAEELLINAANLDYPKPAKVPFLARFYSDQSLKVNHKILPKFPEIEVKAKEEAQSVIDFQKRIVAEEIDAPVKTSISVLIGMDGHVWKAESPEGAKDHVTQLAAASLLGWTFKPLRVSGEPVQMITTFEVTVEPPPALPKRK
jgi:hypothetical protein